MHMKESQEILAPISLGELIDKITILQIKANHLKKNALDNVKTELSALETTLNNLKIDVNPMLIESLKATNEKHLDAIEEAAKTATKRGGGKAEAEAGAPHFSGTAAERAGGSRDEAHPRR